MTQHNLNQKLKLLHCQKQNKQLCFIYHHWYRAARIVAALQPGCEEMKREWGNEEETERKWRDNEEMEREWGNGEKFILYISSFFLYFFPLYPFPTSKFVIFCRKMLNTALLSRMSQKSQHTRYEEIILGRIRCEEALQVVPAWWTPSSSFSFEMWWILWWTPCSMFTHVFWSVVVTVMDAKFILFFWSVVAIVVELQWHLSARLVLRIVTRSKQHLGLVLDLVRHVHGSTTFRLLVIGWLWKVCRSSQAIAKMSLFLSGFLFWELRHSLSLARWV